MTPFGRESRRLRKDRGLLLGEVADMIGCSASFLSQVEAGNKPIPDGLPAKLAAKLDLSARAGADLERAAALSAKEYRISIPKNAQDQDRQVAHLLSVGFARMPAKKKERILRILKEDMDG